MPSKRKARRVIAGLSRVWALCICGHGSGGSSNPSFPAVVLMVVMHDRRGRNASLPLVGMSRNDQRLAALVNHGPSALLRVKMRILRGIVHVTNPRGGEIQSALWGAEPDQRDAWERSEFTNGFNPL